MRVNRFTSVIFLASCASAAVPRAVCNADYCLRAVRATTALNSTTRTLDCSSYFLTIVTPAPITITVTNTLSITLTSTKREILTNTLHETATETERFTATTEIAATTTTITSFDPRVHLVKRDQTRAPTAIPSYASWCSGAVRYSSACSCIGVTAKTTILAPSTATINAETTVYISKTVTVTTATVSKTVTDATNTIQTTDSTRTIDITATATAITKYFAIKVTQRYTSEPDTCFFFPEEPVCFDREVGYIKAGNLRSPDQAGIGPDPYKFWLDSAGILTSELGQSKLVEPTPNYRFAWWYVKPPQNPGGNAYVLKPTIDADFNMTNWGTGVPGSDHSNIYWGAYDASIDNDGRIVGLNDAANGEAHAWGLVDITMVAVPYDD